MLACVETTAGIFESGQQEGHFFLGNAGDGIET